jgi:endonuclease/exonuclease/phosphatase family metal-dependent hydrolase
MKAAVFGRLVGVVCAALVAGALSPHGGAGAATPSEVRVGSFNVSGVHTDSGARGDHRVWKIRRSKVVAQILAQKLDVVGVQEANQSTVYKSRLTYGETQYLDLRGALNAKGGSYALTNTNAYDCVNPRSTYKCVYRDQDASGSNRILYNTRTVSMVRQGSITYSTETAGKPKRHLAWAVFKMKATGKQFLFTNTHLDPYGIPARVRQWDQMITTINSLKGSLPVVAVGDFNTTKFSDHAATYLPRMKSNGYGDVLNQEHRRVTPSTVRAESTYRAWVNSSNRYRRDIRPYAYEDARHKIGNGIDWVFASNNVRVKAWEVVVDLDPRTLRLRGVIPSDHNLVRATLVFP